jgi:hypothetical protein
VLEGIKRGEQHFVVVHTPPRHAKTETLLHFMPWMLKDFPDKRIGYLSYNERIAHRKSRVGRDLAKAAGVRLSTTAVSAWLTPERGGCYATGVGGTLTGEGLDVVLIDDPHKDRASAESGVVRESTIEWFTDTVFSRLQPGGSVIVNMQRWHPGDLAGWLLKEKGWRYICLPAIREDSNGVEHALWPDFMSLAELQLRRRTVGPYGWESQYQGAPRPRGGSLFGDPTLYTELPFQYREAWGIDLAYTEKTAGDWSVLLRLLEWHEGEAPPMYYVAHVRREQVRAPVFKQIVRQEMGHKLWMRPRWYATGPELGAADFFGEPDGPDKPGIPLNVLAPIGDHFVRAQPVAAAWNEGRVLVPADSERYPWAGQFIEEVLNFSGIQDTHDDDIDALAAGFDELYVPWAGAPGEEWVAPGRRY